MPLPIGPAEQPVSPRCQWSEVVYVTWLARSHTRLPSAADECLPSHEADQCRYRQCPTETAPQAYWHTDTHRYMQWTTEMAPQAYWHTDTHRYMQCPTERAPQAYWHTDTHSVPQRWHLRHTETGTRPNFSHNSFLLHNVLLLPAQKLFFSQILPTVDSSSLRTNSTPSRPRRRSNSDHPGKSTYSGEIDYRFLTFQTGSRF